MTYNTAMLVIIFPYFRGEKKWQTTSFQFTYPQMFIVQEPATEVFTPFLTKGLTI